MKKSFLLSLLLIFIACKLSAQNTAGTYLFITNITNGAGTGSHANEVLISNVQQGITAEIPTTGTGTGAGRAKISEVVFSKSFDLSSLRLQNILLRGSQTSVAEIRYYNSTSPTPAYVIVLEDFYISSVSNASSACSAGCPIIEESYSIAPAAITFRNQTVTPNQVLKYDVTRNQITSSGL